MRIRSVPRVAPGALLAVLGFAAACGSSETGPRVPPEGAADNVTLIYQSRVDGEIEPCG